MASARRGSWRAAAAIAVAVGASLAGLVTPAAASTANQWRIANVWGSANGHFESVAATAPASAWAVGTLTHGGPMAAHWNGHAWQTVTIPGARGYYLRQVVASSASNVWVFGQGPDAVSAFRFDGAHWHTVGLPPAAATSPGFGSGQALVFGPRDVWLALWGSCQTTAGKATCSSDVWHWDGSTWTADNVGAAITGFTGLSDHDLRAVALTGKGVVTAYHWNGSRWAGMPIPRASAKNFAEWTPSIAMDSDTDIWIAYDKTTCCSVTALHLTRSGWHQLTPGETDVQTNLALDGHGGAWLGSWAHWTGSGWFYVQHNLYDNDGDGQIWQTVKVPGTSGSYWSAGMVIPLAGNTERPMIAAFGPTP